MDRSTSSTSIVVSILEENAKSLLQFGDSNWLLSRIHVRLNIIIIFRIETSIAVVESNVAANLGTTRMRSRVEQTQLSFQTISSAKIPPLNSNFGGSSNCRIVFASKLNARSLSFEIRCQVRMYLCSSAKRELSFVMFECTFNHCRFNDLLVL